MNLQLCALALVFTSTTSFAEPCLSRLPADVEGGAAVTLVTMNKNSVASYAQSGMAYRSGIPGTGRPARLISNAGAPGSTTTPQVFSDRPNAIFKSPVQHFDAQRADQIAVELTLEQSPQVTITLASWGNVKAVFRVTCSASGVMHGSTADVDYLLILNRVVVQ